ncbi:hypothetical protein C8R45DRAFT_10377 [Mycena sanguinolenta]|nr:hypothetical protein C8R45DRAFT_10377 [Mycena sanguinolenta]
MCPTHGYAVQQLKWFSDVSNAKANFMVDDITKHSLTVLDCKLMLLLLFSNAPLFPFRPPSLSVCERKVPLETALTFFSGLASLLSSVFIVSLGGGAVSGVERARMRSDDGSRNDKTRWRPWHNLLIAWRQHSILCIGI